mmetsp:Transcript_92209/g.237979  ORF Transcript_92209/g.237979 Transcript_92209/m.237979 type:complete len:223 (+) Transcript_92209:404-1072(+)
MCHACSDSGTGKRYSCTPVAFRGCPRTNRLSPPQVSVTHVMLSGRLHSPRALPLLESNACTEPVSARRAMPKPFGKTCSEPWLTAFERSCTARTGTRRLLSVLCPRSCTTRPNVVPTTTQPAFPGRKEPFAASVLLLRQWLLMATDSTDSLLVFRLPAWSQSLEIDHMLGAPCASTSLAQVACALVAEASVAWWPARGSGHSAKRWPCECSTSTRQAEESAS